MKPPQKKTQVLAMVIESTFNSQRKYFHWHLKVLAFFGRYFQIQRAMLSLKSKMGKTSHDRFPKFMLLSRQ